MSDNIMQQGRTEPMLRELATPPHPENSNSVQRAFERRKKISDALAAQKFYEEVCVEAEANMLKTGVLAGAHYAAMQTILKQWKEAAEK